MTSRCEEQKKKIARYLVGDLTEEQKRSLEDHLSTCSLCRSEKEGYAWTLELLQSAQDEPTPRHFFVHNEEPKASPWQLYRRMKPVWQLVSVSIALLFLLIGSAAVSHLHFSSSAEGWNIGFGGEARIAALEAEISKVKNERSRYATKAQIVEVQTGMENILTALELQDSKLTEQIATGQIETLERLTALYRARVQDLENIGGRFDSLELNTDAKLTVLQAALRSDKTEN